MAIATIPQTITNGQISIYLAANDNSLGDLFGGRLAAPRSPITIALITDALSWGYTGGAQSDTDLRETANYLTWLIGKYGQRAQLISQGSGGGTVIPSGGTGSGFSFEYLVEVFGGVPDFTNSTDYNNLNIVGRNLVVFWNDIPRFLIAGTEWAYTPTGIRILIDGFDATVNEYNIKIFIKNPLGTSGSTGSEVTRPFQFTGTGTETSITSSILAGSIIISVSRGTPYELIYTGLPSGLQALINLDANSLSNGTINFDIGNPIGAGEVVEIIFSKAV